MTAEPFIVPVPEISWIQGLPFFIRLSDIYPVPGVDMFEVTAITDYNCMLRLSWERTNPPANPGGAPLRGTVEDVGPLIRHRLAVPSGTIVQNPTNPSPQEVRFTIDLSPSDSSGRNLRPYIGTLKLRQTPHNFVPVRFYQFGGDPPPPSGGDGGDWNTYAWAQYNPSGQPFSFPGFAYLDLNGTNGSETMPVARVISRVPAPGGVNISIDLKSPVPDVAGAIPGMPDPLQSATLEVMWNTTVVERFTWAVPQPGELEAVEALIRATADSKYIRVARLIENPSSDPQYTFMGPNYWLTGQADAALVQPS